MTETIVTGECIRLRRDPAALTVAALLGEIVLGGCMLYDPHPVAYDIIRRTFSALDAGEEVARVASLALYGVLSDLGFRPVLDKCVECGADIARKDDLALSGIKGGVVCSECGYLRGGSAIDARQLSILRYMAKSGFDCLDHLKMDSLDAETVLTLLVNYTQNVMGKGLKSARILSDLLTNRRVRCA